METNDAVAVETASGTASTADRRRSARRVYNASAWLSAETGTRDGNQQVSVYDLSLHGLGFTCDRPLVIDAVHWIVIGGGGLRASSRVRVASCRQREDGKYDVGGEFF